MAASDELEAERSFMEGAEERLETIRAEAAAVADEVRRMGAGGTQQARLERDVRVTNASRRLARLNIGSAPLVIGRIDNDSGEVWRIGRLAVDDTDREPMVVDWRAPAAQPFYQATPGDHRGVIRRRHYEYSRRRLVGMQDELLDVEADTDDLVLVGEGALLAALESRRSGRMADIVATIQKEQDEIIRASLGGVLVVQGGPGTGKTAVALHRAAYLLYTHPVPLETTGVLLIGPNPTFLRYVEHVLPSLGEHTVTLATPSSLVDGMEVTARDALAVARLKGDLRMERVLTRARALLCRPLREDLEVADGATRLLLRGETSTDIVRRARRATGSHAARRRLVERLVGEALVEEKRAAQRRLLVARRASAEAADIDADEAVRVAARLLNRPEVRRALNRIWPPLGALGLVETLWRSPALLARAASGVLEESEVEVLVAAPSGPEAGWTTADVALVDEARSLLGPGSEDLRRSAPAPAPGSSAEAFAHQEMVDRVLAEYQPACPRCRSDLDWSPSDRRWVCEACQRRFAPERVMDPARQHLFESVLNHLTDGTGRGEDDRSGPAPVADRTFGHVVVDEAQELSPMQWRMVARRCPSRSLTVVGDLAQASGAWAASSWAEALGPVTEASSVPLRVSELTVNYRTPEEVMVHAGAVLARSHPEMRPPRSARRGGLEPYLVPLGSEGSTAAVEVVQRCVRFLLGEMGAEGTLGVIAPARLAADLALLVEDPPDRVSVLDLETAKGLEFDAVVVADPASLMAEAASGAAGLYVALTRTTNWLIVVGGEELEVLSGFPRRAVPAGASGGN